MPSELFTCTSCRSVVRKHVFSRIASELQKVLVAACVACIPHAEPVSMSCDSFKQLAGCIDE